MYKKIMLVLLISSPLQAVKSQGISKRVGGTFVAPSLTQAVNETVVRKKESRFPENIDRSFCFRPRAVFVLLAGAVAMGGSAMSDITKKAASLKTD